MRDQTVTNGVALSGNFNSYNTSANPMTRVGATSVYTTTITVADGYALSYKFVNGIGSGGYEPNPGVACGPNNRAYAVPSTNTTIATVCFGSCNACPPKYSVTFRVNLSTQTVTGSVALVGDFNSFNPATNPMTLIGGGVYQTTVSLAAGTHIYKFYNTGGPNSGYENGLNLPCGNGSNRTFNVTAAASLPVVCYNSCIDCGATNTWTGAQNIFYTDSRNWTAGVAPSGTDPVQINVAANQPTNNSGSQSVGNFGIAGGAVLTLTGGAGLNISGNLTGTGGRVTGGAVLLNGSGAQTATGAQTFDDLTVSKAAGSATFSGNTRVRGTPHACHGSL